MFSKVIATVALLLLATPALAAGPPWAGTWNVSARTATAEASASLTLTADGDKVTGSSGPLDENRFFPLTLTGKHSGKTVTLDAVGYDSPVGQLTLSADGKTLTGKGMLYGTALTLTGVRPDTAPRAPKTYDFKPTTYALQYSTKGEPALRVHPGDTVSTSTLDNLGRDKDLVWRAMPGNTLTGPIFVEGAMPGDTLVVRIDRVALNRDTAEMYASTLNERVLPGGYRMEPTKGWSRIWKLDRQTGVARPAQPSEALAGFELPLKPMIGSIGVAPPRSQALYAGDVGFHGGNLDYNRLVEGTTLYLPVWAAGAWLYLGDGHAAQGDGEITGQGLETSLDVTVTVDLVRGKMMPQPWMEDAEFVMVSGIDNGLDASLAMATTGLVRWLKDRYGLTDSEAATVLGGAVQYDVAEVVDTRPHVVAKLPKKVLAMIRKTP